MLRLCSILAVTFLVFALGMVPLPALVPLASAGSECVDFRALGQATLPTSTPLSPMDVWGGPLYAVLGQELLLGVFSGHDGDVSWRGAIGAGRMGSYTVCFGSPCTDSFTYDVSNAVFPNPPGKIGFGQYIGNTAKIVRGTGRFQWASGNLTVAGPYIAWTPDGGTTWLGRFNAELSGKICGVR